MRYLNMRRLLLAALAVALVVITVGATTQQGVAEPTAQQQEEPPRVVKTEHRHPKKKITRRYKFTPSARPSISRVHYIIRYEARKWGASAGHLSSRINCESGYRWYASNGQYQGLGQFAYSTFQRGMSTIHTRRVRIIRHRSRWVKTWIISHWSDGRTTRMRGKRMKQYIRAINTGWIPRSPGHTHGWAQVRIMAQAMVGRSAVHDSEWQCR